uniref:dihydrofolate reductase n=1 Tax=viral metagenome TaxID=1070528 RepID=A0A6C0JAF1_9ZZZZ
MKLARFNIICLVDAKNGMSSQNMPPFNIQYWAKYVNNITIGVTNTNKPQNAIIMGKNTYLFFKRDNQTVNLPKRDIFIISTKQNNDCIFPIFSNMTQCLASIASNKSTLDIVPETWVIGGSKLIKTCLDNYMPYINKIILCKMKSESESCDLFFPMEALKNIPYTLENSGEISRYEIRIYTPNMLHPEYKYLSLLKDTVGAPTINKFNKRVHISHDKYIEFYFKKIKQTIEMPFITTRNIFPDKILAQVIDDLQSLCFSDDGIGFRLRSKLDFIGRKIYDEEADKSFEQKTHIHDPLQNLLRKFFIAEGAFQDIIRFHRENENEPLGIEYMKIDIPPSKSSISMHITFTHIDLVKDMPYYIAYFSIMLAIIAKKLLIPSLGKLSFFMNDCLIDIEHQTRILTQLKYDPKPFSHLIINYPIEKLEDLMNGSSNSNIFIDNYDAWNNFKLD